MPIPSKPPLLRNVIGYDADVFSLPDTTVDGSGALSYESGWPRITATSLKAGGKAPQREYFNQVNKLLSQHLFFLQSGNLYDWSASLNYNTGAHVLGSDGLEYVAVSPSGPDVPGVGAKDPAGSKNKAQWLLLAALLTSSDGGLVVDPVTGKVAVDFEQMSPDKFETILKQIRVPIWLDEDKNFYVNGSTGSDTLDEGRGESEAKPFKTIQACVNYVTDNYNVSRFVARIIISPGTYRSFELPSYSRTTGYCAIVGNKSNTFLESSSTKTETAILADGSYWVVDGLSVKVSSENITASATYPTAIIADNYGYIRLANVSIELLQMTNSGSINRLRGIEAIRFGSIDIREGCSVNGSYEDSQPNRMVGLISYSGGRISLQYPEDSQSPLGLFGDYSVVAAAEGGTIERAVPNLGIVIGTATGKRYQVALGGNISVQGAGEEYFPGTQNGTVESSTFSWYK